MTEISHPIEDFQMHVQPLIGLTVSNPWKGYGSAIFLELGNLTSKKLIRATLNEGEACICVQWDWRVEANTRILYGSSNSRPEIESGISTLQGETIQSLAIVGQIPELIVQFSNGHYLRSMAMLTGGPEWYIKLLDERWMHTNGSLLLVNDGVEESEREKQETSFFALEEVTAARWRTPIAEPKRGLCQKCPSFVRLDGDGPLLSYGVCIAAGGPFDGRVVSMNSGCPLFSSDEET